MDFGLQGKHAFVGGGSRGIGKGIARVLAQEGMDVVIASRTFADLERSAREIEDETGQRIIPIALDVTQRDQVDQVMAQAAEQLGGLHVVVNSASLPGGSPTAVGPIETVNEDDLLSDFDVKYVGALRCARASIPYLKEQGYGRIINISGGNARNAGNLSGGARNVSMVHLTKTPFDSTGALRHHRQLHSSRHHPHRAHRQLAGGEGSPIGSLARGSGTAGLFARLRSGQRHLPHGRRIGDRLPDRLPGVGQSLGGYRRGYRGGRRHRQRGLLLGQQRRRLGFSSRPKPGRISGGWLR